MRGIELRWVQVVRCFAGWVLAIRDLWPDSLLTRGFTWACGGAWVSSGFGVFLFGRVGAVIVFVQWLT